MLSAAGAAGGDGPVLDGTLAGGGSYMVRPIGGVGVAAIALWYRAPAGGFDATAVPGLGRLAAATVAASQPVTGTALADFVRQVGGRLAINTYPESVSLSVQVPANRAGEAIRAITRSFFAPVVTDAGLTLAKRSVLEDSAERSFDRNAQINDAIYATLFAAGPAKIPPYGSTSAFDDVTLDRVRAYAERAFRPGNAVLILSGAVDPSLVSNALPGRGDAAPGAETPQPETLAPPAAPVQAAAPEPGFGMGWAGPPIADEREATAFDFIADYLFYPDTGVVQQAVRDTGTTLVGTFVTYHDPGVFLFSSSGGDQPRVRAAVEAALDAIRVPLDPAAFAAARNQFVYHILSDEQTPAALADTYGWYAVEGNAAYAPGNGGPQSRYFADAAALTPQFVAATAAKYLSRPGAVITLAPQAPQ